MSGSDASLNSLNVTAGVTGSLLGTASYATQALTASNADTASYVVTAQTASYVLQAVSASFASTASFVNPLNQDIRITGSVTHSGSLFEVASNGGNFRVGKNGIQITRTDGAALYSTLTYSTSTTLDVDTTIRANSGQYGNRSYQYPNVGISLGYYSGKWSAQGGGTGATQVFELSCIDTSNTTNFFLLKNGSTQLLVMSSSGDLLVGTGNTNGAYRLDVSGSGNFRGNLTVTGSASNSLRVKGSGATSATNALLIENSGNTGSLVVRDDARVGINTTTPNTTLDVNGNVIVTGSLTAYSSINIPILPPSFYYPTLTIANTTLQGYQTSGNVFTISNTGYTIEFGSNRGYMIFVSAGHHYFQSGGSNTRMFISSSGRIGIAKSSSLNATLDIIGSQVITGSLEVSAGITGSFLGTASYAAQALTASFYGGSVTSASFASTASYVNPLNQNVTITGASSNSLRVKGSGTTSATNAMLVENSAGTSILNIADNGDSTITGSLAISTLGATLLSLGPSGSEYMVARASGYIGINNTTPTGFLHIRSSQNNGSTWVLLAQNSTAALPGNNNGGPGTILAIRDDYKVSITGSTNISGSLTVTGSANFGGGITGSFLGTASYASMALTASYALSSAGGGGGGSTFPYTGSAIISGSLVVTGSFAVITGSTVEFQVLPTGVKIGETSTDVHTVTGSLNVSGSISATTLSGSDDRLLFATSAGIISASSQTLVSAYINPAGTIAGYLNNTSSWDINGDYSGSAITGTYQGQKHYNSNYFFEAVDDNIWIRLIRG